MSQLKNQYERGPRLPETGYVRLPLILQLYPVGESTWWAGVRSGKYPQPIKLGTRTTAWRVEDIRKLLEQAEVLHQEYAMTRGINKRKAKRKAKPPVLIDDPRQHTLLDALTPEDKRSDNA